MCGKISGRPRTSWGWSGEPHAHSTLCCERIGSQFARFPNPAGGVEPAQLREPRCSDVLCRGRAGLLCRFFSTSVALGRDSLCRTESEKGARLGVRGPQRCCVSSRMTRFVLPCVSEDVLENRSPSPSLLGWAKTFLPRSGRHDNMLSPAHCDALWCRDSFRSRCREEISGPIIWVPLPALLRGFWAGCCSLPSDREESPNSEQFRQKSTKSVRASALVWTNLSCSRMRRSRACHRCAPR